MKYFKGDALEAKNVDAIMHGCNCLGAMGAGIALQVKNRFPEAYEVYKEMERTIGLHPGWFSVCDVYDPPIVNLHTQDVVGKGSARLEWIELSITRFKETLPIVRHQRKFAMPKIGAGLGGLNWNDVEQLLIVLEKRLWVEFYVYEFDAKL